MAVTAMETARAARGDMTQKEFAAVMGVSRQTVIKWETGVFLPKLFHWLRMQEIIEQRREL